MPQVFLAANRVKYIDIDYYMHYQREGSISRTKDQVNNSLDKIKISYKLEKFYESVKGLKQRSLLSDRLVSLYLNAFLRGKLYNCSGFELDYNFLLRNVKSVKNIILVMLLLLNRKLFLKIHHSRLKD